MEALTRVTGATLDVLRILVTASEPTWGLQVIAATGRPAGSVYPILARLEHRGWVTSAWEDGDRRGPRRRLYALTEDATSAARVLLDEHQHQHRARPQPGWSLS